jgi:uncharacterized repeat protein (TIGR01451 family)
MKKTKLVSILSAVTLFSVLAIASPVFAWQPKGTIEKKVQDQTTNSALTGGDDNTLTSVNTGDTLRYVIVVHNIATADANGNNDMADVVLTDKLPAGVELISNPSEQQITVNLGTIKPQSKATTEYLVKVVSTEDNSLIKNTSCFTGNSIVNDNPQSGCDSAIVKVSVPKTPPAVTPPVTTAPTSTPAVSTPQVLGAATTAAVLPNTGPGDTIILAIVVAAIGYIASLVRLKIKQKRARL